MTKTGSRGGTTKKVASRVPLDQFFQDDTITYLWVIWSGGFHRQAKLGIPHSVSAITDYIRERNNHEIVRVTRQVDGWSGEEDIIALKREVLQRNDTSGEGPGRVVPVVAFCGHGDKSGNWQLTDKEASLDFLIHPEHGDLYDLGRPLIIITEACYAGNWCVSRQVEKWGNGVTIVVGAGPGEHVWERSASPGEEGNFWKLLLGRATNECSYCKALRTKKVKSYKDYTKHICTKVTLPFAFDSGTLLQWDDSSKVFARFGLHKCDESQPVPRLPVPSHSSEDVSADASNEDTYSSGNE